MTAERARTIANVVLVSAGAAAAVVVLTKPPLRRLAFQALRHWLGGVSVPQYLMAETRRAWAASGAALEHAS